VMDVHGSFATHLARDEVTYVITEMIEVCQGVFFHNSRLYSFSN